ncbi:MAG: stress response translation initiation inhibitor YciH [Candidatus Odinarchaeota archaeon]|nr:stress response translation initiation inhibitor YciH [Candidatus Odinarchaeota archaeon]
MDRILEEISKEEVEIQVTIEKRKFGKPVTVIRGFPKDVNLREIASTLKSRLACGGSVKNDSIELQGDHRRNIKKVLEELGFTNILVL